MPHRWTVKLGARMDADLHSSFPTAVSVSGTTRLHIPRVQDSADSDAASTHRVCDKSRSASANLGHD